MTTPEQQRKNNVRLGLILASIAAVFFLGFVVKMMFLRH
ncbi:MAG: cytochrome oxidase small assembly protein [Pseudomonadota bacterium]